MNAPKYSAFTSAYSGIARQLRSNVFISDGLLKPSQEDPEKSSAKEYVAIWDTGASMTSISRRVVSELALHEIARNMTNTAAGETETTIHRIHLWLPNRIIIQKCLASCIPGLTDILGIDMLIGMDIISKGDITISNYQGKTVLSFRMPSVGITDYVKESESS